VKIWLKIALQAVKIVKLPKFEAVN